MKRYRIECNYGCRYFENIGDAHWYFMRCRSKNLHVEFWTVIYTYDAEHNRYQATQELKAYSFPPLH